MLKSSFSYRAEKMKDLLLIYHVFQKSRRKERKQGYPNLGYLINHQTTLNELKNTPLPNLISSCDELFGLCYFPPKVQ
ncbi:hypothetical protein PEDI_38120 [Persicobacter diffluens]|uniref:Uncharacterized protein n=1 Tax=Persicobacter diffluens TaxID=981 RepID=A0AAN4W3E3_9BACT|nr:hypothetical protein PEDI_38120 [Persicobacter diffluens]